MLQKAQKPHQKLQRQLDENGRVETRTCSSKRVFLQCFSLCTKHSKGRPDHLYQALAADVPSLFQKEQFSRDLLFKFGTSKGEHSGAKRCVTRQHSALLQIDAVPVRQSDVFLSIIEQIQSASEWLSIYLVALWCCRPSGSRVHHDAKCCVSDQRTCVHVVHMFESLQFRSTKVCSLQALKQSNGRT